MSEDNVYQDAEIVWVKLRSCWWPGEVCSHHRQPEGLLKHTKRKPYCVVKFFQEDSFEYVKNSKMIYPFNCSKKDEFIRKGHALLAKNKYMEQFPAAVSTAERLTRSLTRSSLFFNSRPDSIIKAILTDSPPQSERTRNGRQCEIIDKILKKTNTPEAKEKSQPSDQSPIYKCTMCDFQSTRQNVLVLHRRSHSGSGTRPQRSSSDNRPIISPLNGNKLQISPEITNDEEFREREPQIKKVTPVTAPIRSEPEDLTPTKIVTESIKTIPVHTEELPKEQVVTKEKQNPIKPPPPTVSIRPPPKKQLNFINNNCKSENIQKSLLADWLDEEKDDDEENDNEGVKPIEVIDIQTKSQNSTISVSTLISPEKAPSQVAVDQNTYSVLSEHQKPTLKIRNIPKKDRRNIVFQDFNKSDDVCCDSQSQETTSIDVGSSRGTNEATIKDNLEESPEKHIEASVITYPIEQPVSEVFTSETNNILTPIEDISYTPQASSHDKSEEIVQDSIETTLSALHADQNAELSAIPEIQVVKESTDDKTTKEKPNSFEELMTETTGEHTPESEIESQSILVLPTPEESTPSVSEDLISDKSKEIEENTEALQTLESSKEVPLEEGNSTESFPTETNIEERNNNETTTQLILVESDTDEPEMIEAITQVADVVTEALNRLEASEETVTVEASATDCEVSSVEPSAADVTTKNLEEITSDEPKAVEASEIPQDSMILDEPEATEEPTMISELLPTEDTTETLPSIGTEKPTEPDTLAIANTTVIHEDDVDKLDTHDSLTEPTVTADIITEVETPKFESTLNTTESYNQETIHENQSEPQEIITDTEISQSAPIPSPKLTVNECTSDGLVSNEEQIESTDLITETNIPQENILEAHTTEKHTLFPEEQKSFEIEPSVSAEAENQPKETPTIDDSLIKSLDEEVSTETLSNQKNKKADGKKTLNERKISLRSSTPRGCKKIAFKPKKIKKKLKDQILYDSLEEQKTDSSSFDANKDLSEVQQSSETHGNLTVSAQETELENTACVLSTQSQSESNEQSTTTEVPLDGEPKPEPETKIHPPLDLELEDSKPLSTETMESKSRSSYSKASLACFDFNEEEDILTSIANFKKTYISQEKSYNFGLDNHPKTPDSQKHEFELKDKQLSADIESLLKTTELPVKMIASAASKPLSNEVHGLPIKERGKRIFKSRNRFRVESGLSSFARTTTTTTTDANPVSSSSFSLKGNDAVPEQKSQMPENNSSIETNENVTSNVKPNDDDVANKSNEETFDFKDINLEEEVIGRIVFSPKEVSAPMNDETSNEPEQLMENLVDSGDTEMITRQDTESNEQTNEDNMEYGISCQREDDEIKIQEPLNEGKIQETEEEPLEEFKVPETEGEESIDELKIQESEEDEFKIQETEEEPAGEAKIQDIDIKDSEKDLNEIENLYPNQSPAEDEENNFAQRVTESKLTELESNEPIYDKQHPVDEDEIDKVNDSICESPFEYELVTTEVTTIVDNCPKEQNVENTKESSVELLEEVVSCCDDGTFLNEMIIADVIDSQSSVAENEIENTIVVAEEAKEEVAVAVANPTDESNSSSIKGIGTQLYADDEIDIHVSQEKEDKLPVAAGEHPDAFSDDSSTIISDAEAEFGSPTSMLDDERTFNRTRSGSETPAVGSEGKAKTKRSNRKAHFNLQNSHTENKLQIQSDTQESTSNDVVNELVYYENNYANSVKQSLLEPELFRDDKIPFSDKSMENPLTDKQTTEIQENEKQTEVIANAKDGVDSSYENSDSSDEEEEEICSPPIEPLLDDDTEAETIQNNSTETSLSKSEKSITTKTQSEDTRTVSGTEDGASIQMRTDEEEANGKQSNAYYTITQKSDTKIKLNKQKDKSLNDDEQAVKEWTETSVDVRKSELAGEELTAAEALLLIPKQTTNVLETSFESSKKHDESEESFLVDVKNLENLLDEDEIKDECIESPIADDLDLNVKEENSKETVQRKRRSHMKVTPRKRVIDETKPDDQQKEETTGIKMQKLTNNSTESENKSSDNFENSFVLKYMKEQLTEGIDSLESIDENAPIYSGKTKEKQTLEKVHITVDISNPLSSQIATILGTNRSIVSSDTPLAASATKKRKMSVEDDIPSFIIKRPCVKTIAEEEAADRETIAQIQNLCPQVEITRKSSKDDPNASTTTTPTPQQTTTIKPQIINQQILRTGNHKPTITVTAKCNKNDDGMFDISNMPIVLSNENIINDKVHFVITPTTNPQIIKQLQNQQQQQLLSTTTTSTTTGPNTSNFAAAGKVTKHGIPVRRSSSVRTKRTPSRQQLPEQIMSDNQSFDSDQFNQQQINVQQESNQSSEYLQSKQELQIQHQLQQDQNQLQLLQGSQLSPQQNQFQQQLQAQQQQHAQHHQNQIQKQLQEENNMLMHQQQQQQQQQLLLEQQLQLQQQLQNQQQLDPNDGANHTEKQIGTDNRGNKYLIIRNPTNSVVMANNLEANKVQPQLIQQQQREPCDQISQQQRKQRQKKQPSHTMQTTELAKSQLPVTSATTLSVSSTQPNQPHQYYNEQQVLSTCAPVMPTVTPKPKGRGRGRPPKNRVDTNSMANTQATNNNVKTNANGRRSTGRICEPPRQRSARSMPVTTSTEAQHTAMIPTTQYISQHQQQQQQQQTQTIGFMMNPQFNSIAGSSQNIRVSNESYQTQAQTQTMTMSPQSRQPTTSDMSIEPSEVSGGGYAVPSLPVPGYPQTYLLCELVGNKYKEVFPKPLYLSPDRTRFLEVPDELVTEAHKKLSDSRREPNPNALKLVSDGSPHILQSRLIEINADSNMVSQNDDQQNDLLMQKQQHLSVEEQASALLCLQEQLNQEQLVHKQITQEQLVRDQFVEEQFVQEQFVPEQFVPEQFVQEQFVQEQYSQEQFVQEQFVQEQFVQEQFVQEQFNLQPQQFSLQLARFETGEVIEDAERGQMMVVTTGTHNLILDDKSFFEFTGEKRIDFYNAEKDTYILTPEVISNLLHHYALGHITAVPALNTDIGDHQQEVSIADVIQNADSSTNILEVALDDSGLYSEEQFINSGEILQIETPEGMQLIGTAADNADLIFHHMAKANTNETNVLLNQGPKMSAVEIPSDKSKRRFNTKPSTPTTLEDCLNVIGVPIQSPNVPTSLELPASVTNPTIVAKTRTPTPGTITMNEIISTGLCHHPDITSLPSMSSNDQELSYEFFPSTTEAIEDKDHTNEESVVTDMAEYSVVTSSASYDDPGR